MLVARVLEARSDPVALARALVRGGASRVALLHASAREAPLGLGRWSYVAADPDAVSRELDPFDDRAAEARVANGELGHVPRWIGVVPYEARRSALKRPGWRTVDAREAPRLTEPTWHRYSAVVAFDHDEGRVLVVGTRAARVRELGDFAARALDVRIDSRSDTRIEIAEPESASRHAARVAAARELIASGDLYQVNLARRLDVKIARGDVLGLYERFAASAPSPFGSYLELGGGVAIASSSPELLLRAEAALDRPGFGTLYTAPIKGTRPRGADAARDSALARELDADAKERAELAMIVDVERNDLGRVSAPGSVRVPAGPRVETHRTVHHRAALIGGRARRDVTREAVIAAMVPSGSVTGAPKIRAMEVIANLESERRGLYTGAIGFLAHDGSATLAMAIRTAVLRGDAGDYWTGGGIVADSDPAREVEETRWKSAQLARAVEAAR